MDYFSALLSVYAKENPVYFNMAFASLWDNQSLKPSQIVLVKDGPLPPDLDSTLASWSARLGDVLTIISLPENVGLAAALNKGLEYCKFDLVARMDTDDLAMPDRFLKQLEFMTNNPEVTASSSFIEEFDDSGLFLGLRKLPLSHAEIVKFAKRRSPLSHPATIFRKEAVLSVGGYPLFRNAQDYALWTLLIINGYKLANLPDVLVKMRTGSEMYNRRGLDYFKKELQLLRYQRRIGFLSWFDFLMNVLSRGFIRLSPVFLKKWLYRMIR